MKPSSSTTVARYVVIAIVLLIAAAAYYWGAYLPSMRKLPIPTDPPAFGVTYLYSFGSAFMDTTSPTRVVKQDIEKIKSAGFTCVKVNFPFAHTTTYANMIADAAAEKGLYPIGQLIGHEEKPTNRAFTEDELRNWEQFVRAEVRRNKDRIYFWEIWNEPAMTQLRFRYGTPSEYLDLLRRSYAIIKEENPSARVIVTADYTDTEAEAFTNEFLNLGGTAYFDYLSFHPYNAIDPDARLNLEETIAQEKALSEKYAKPLWITEIGYPDSDSDKTRQAEIAAQLFTAASQSRIPIVWFHWSDARVSSVDGKTGWGLIREDGTHKPVYDEIKAYIGQ